MLVLEHAEVDLVVILVCWMLLVKTVCVVLKYILLLFLIQSNCFLLKI